MPHFGGCGNGCWNNFYKTIITINKAAGLQGGGISKRCVKQFKF